MSVMVTVSTYVPAAWNVAVVVAPPLGLKSGARNPAAAQVYVTLVESELCTASAVNETVLPVVLVTLAGVATAMPVGCTSFTDPEDDPVVVLIEKAYVLSGCSPITVQLLQPGGVVAIGTYVAPLSEL